MRVPFKSVGLWYYRNVRERPIGPFSSRDEAWEALERYQSMLANSEGVERCKEYNDQHDWDQRGICRNCGVSEPCDHEGSVVNGVCQVCGEDYESDAETYAREAPR